MASTEYEIVDSIPDGARNKWGPLIDDVKAGRTVKVANLKARTSIGAAAKAKGIKVTIASRGGNLYVARVI